MHNTAEEREGRLKRLAKKVFHRYVHNPEFIAYYLVRYKRLLAYDFEQMLEVFNCSRMAYYRLGLCKLPDGAAGAAAALSREVLAKIDEYDASTPQLLRMIIYEVKQSEANVV